MNYVVIFEKSSTGWGAYVPDLPGCIATARTRAEIEPLIQEAIAFHIEGMREDGEVVPEPSSEAALVSVPA
jgi:predicted RNase H-like HicB family nuclease